MRESSVYQRILSEGRSEGLIEGERHVLIRQATTKFGPANEATVLRLQGVTEPDALDRLTMRLLSVDSWDELLQ
jgi:predicted transposase YdaD